MLNLRCSKLGLALACPASTVPPEVRIEGCRDAADLGTALHAYMTCHVNAHDPLHHRFSPMPVEFCPPGFDADEFERLCAWARRAWESQRKYFPNPQTDVEMAWECEDEGLTLTGHTDVMTVFPRDSLGALVPSEVRIADWKSGRLDENHDDQIKGYCFLALKKYPDIDRAYGSVIRIRERTVDGAYYGRDELEVWFADLVSKMKDRETYIPGRHCRWCPRAATCPAKTALLVQAREGLLDFHMLGCQEPGAVSNIDLVPTGELPGRVPLTPLALGKLYDRVQLIERVCQDAREMIRADVAAAGGEVQIGDGRKLVLREEEHRHIAAYESWDLLRNEFSEEAILKTLGTVPKSEVEKLAKGKAGRGGKGKAVAALLKRLEEAGAITETFVERLEVRRSLQAIPRTRTEESDVKQCQK